MSSQLFQQLEEKIGQSLEVIELFRLQLEECEDKITALMKENAQLTYENTTLKNRQAQWEQNLSSLLSKLADADLATGNLGGTRQEVMSREEEEFTI
jgi:cell division protein ZapB